MKTSLATDLFPSGEGSVFAGGGGWNVRVKGSGAENF